MSPFVVGLPVLFQATLHWWPKPQTLTLKERNLYSEIYLQAKPVLSLQNLLVRASLPQASSCVVCTQGHPGRPQVEKVGSA